MLELQLSPPKKDCPNPSVCFHCEKEGHAARDCPRKMYGEYFADILEGNESSDRESLDSECSFQTGVDDRKQRVVDDRKQRVDSGPHDDAIQELHQEREAVTQSEPLVVDSTGYTSTDKITPEAEQPIKSNIGCKQVDSSTR